MEFLHQWQELIGSLAGTFLAAIFALIAFYFRNKLKNVAERREARRRVEISMARSLNDLFSAETELVLLLSRIDKIIFSIGEILYDDLRYSLEETNFPQISIFLDSELPLIRTRSYYIHNKILWFNAGMQKTALFLGEMKENFGNLFKMSQFLVGIKASQREQKETAIENLRMFRDLITNQMVPSLRNGLKVGAQIKIYNQKLREKYWGVLNLWTYEGVAFRYFKNSKDLKKFNQELDCIDRIDLLIEPEVKASLEEAETRR